MLDLPGDPEITKLFGFPGFEALIRVILKYVNQLRQEQGNPELSYEEFRAEIEVEAQNIGSQ